MVMYIVLSLYNYELAQPNAISMDAVEILSTAELKYLVIIYY